jgi:hypothetical protein
MQSMRTALALFCFLGTLPLGLRSQIAKSSNTPMSASGVSISLAPVEPDLPPWIRT